MTDHRLRGFTAELYVLFRISQWDFTASRIPAGAQYDLIFKDKENFYRVQVKSTLKTRSTNNQSKQKYATFDVRNKKAKIKGPYKKDAYDVLALYLHSKERAIFLPYNAAISRAFKSEMFTEQNERESWQACLDALREQ